MRNRFQTLHNAIFNTSSWVLSIVFNFIFLPYIVHKLGTEAYGILILVLSVIGYFALLDLDLGQAVTKYVAQYRAAGDMQTVTEIIGVTLSIYLFLGLVGAGSILLMANIIVTHFFKIQHDLLPAARMSLSLGACGFFFTMLLTSLAAIPNGLNRYDISSKVSIVMSLCTTGLTVLLLYAGFGLVAVVSLNVILSAVGVACYLVIVKQLLPEVALRPILKRQPLRKVLGFGVFSSLSRLSYIIQFQTDRILTGAILGASWVTYYFVPFSIVKKAMTVTSQIGGVILPVVSALQGNDDPESVSRLYFKASRLIITIATAICLPILLFGDRFLGLWMGEEFAAKSGLVMLLITISLYADAFTNVPSFVVQGLDRPKVTGMFAMANAIVNVGLIYPLGKRYGITGIAMAFLVSSVGSAPLFIHYANKHILNISTLRLIREAYWPPISAALLAVVPFLFIRRHPVPNLLSLLAIMAMCSLSYLLVSLLTGVFKKEEREQVIGYLLHVMGRKQEATDR